MSSYGLEAGFDQLSDGFDAAGQALLGMEVVDPLDERAGHQDGDVNVPIGERL
jgi:hypothetical protein